MVKTYIGIDPGKTGGLAVIPNYNGDTYGNIYAREMPIGSDKDLDITEIDEYIGHHSEYSCMCVIEKAQSMPKQGVKGVFNYGVGYGKLLAILELNDIPYQEIPSQKWKKEFTLIKKGKAESVRMAEKLFPELKGQFVTPRGRLKDGMAESLLMAEYGRRKNL